MQLSPEQRQRLVDWILRFWRFMPTKVRIWAFKNDKELQDDCQFDPKR